MSDIRDRLQDTARTIASILPPGTGFVLLAFDFDQAAGTSRLEYVSNATRQDVIPMMEEFIVKTKAGWAQHLHDPPLKP